MINIIDGDVTKCTEKIIAHQVNYFGRSGAGVALTIRNKYPEACKEYSNHCHANSFDKAKLKGTIHIAFANDGKWIASLFSQNGWRTDYDDLRICLNELHRIAKHYDLSVAIPYKMSCGLAQGDWDGIVYPMIEEILSDINLTIYKLV